jgi:hypothetical protein
MNDALADAILAAIEDVAEPLHARISALEDEIKALKAGPAPSVDPETVARQLRTAIGGHDRRGPQ